jgi:hypothetical protein
VGGFDAQPREACAGAQDHHQKGKPAQILRRYACIDAGGVSSYCLVLLAVAYLKENPSEGQSSDCLFEELVEFIRKFHRQRLVINVVEKETVRVGEGEMPVLVSPWDGRNLVERAFRFEEVVAALENWKEALLN